MAEELEKRAFAAFVDDDFEQAVELFTQAISHDSGNPDLFVQRAQAHIKLQNYTDAVADANRAIQLKPSLSKAYLRKGIACFSLEEYQTAKAAFLAGSELEPRNSSFKSWIQKCDAALIEEDASNGDQLLKSSSATQGALGRIESTMERQMATEFSEEQGSMLSPPVPIDLTSEATVPVISPPPVYVQPKFRHDFYEQPTEVVVTIFAKGKKKEDVNIDFGEQFLSVVIHTPNEDPYILQLRLYGKIIVPQCRYIILGTKIEIRLVKAESIHWKCLEYDKKQIAPQPHNVSREVSKAKIAYPSSYKNVNRDWEKLEAEVKKEEKEEKLEGDAALNKLFRDIYRDADEDTRRAMNKSFVESSGTVLSTNWKEVGSKYVEGSAPQGMEMKKWEV